MGLGFVCRVLVLVVVVVGGWVKIEVGGGAVGGVVRVCGLAEKGRRTHAHVGVRGAATGESESLRVS